MVLKAWYRDGFLKDLKIRELRLEKLYKYRTKERSEFLWESAELPGLDPRILSFDAS